MSWGNWIAILGLAWAILGPIVGFGIKRWFKKQDRQKDNKVFKETSKKYETLAEKHLEILEKLYLSLERSKGDVEKKEKQKQSNSINISFDDAENFSNKIDNRKIINNFFITKEVKSNLESLINESELPNEEIKKVLNSLNEQSDEFKE